MEQDLTYAWRILEGEGALDPIDAEIATFGAANEPGEKCGTTQNFCSRCHTVNQPAPSVQITRPWVI